jgi:AAA+ superfamily predicted ATPase
MQWQYYNNLYLSAALAWLRLKLTHLSDPQAVTLEQIEDAEAKMVGAENLEYHPALSILGQQLGLSQFEQQTLLLCAAMALDIQIGYLCSQAQDNSAQPYPTFALALALFDQPSWDIMSPERPLRYWRLIEIHQSAVQTLTTSPLRADERIVSYIKGLNYLDDRVAAFVFPLPEQTTITLPHSQQTCVTEIVETWHQSRSSPIYQLLGADSPSKQIVAKRACEKLGVQLYRFSLELLPTQINELETLIRLWQRETLLLPVALYLNIQSLDDNTTSVEKKVAARHFITRSESLIFLDVYQTGFTLDKSTINIDINKPTLTEQQQAWQENLNLFYNHKSQLLASQFNLDISTIYNIANSATSEFNLWQSCLKATRQKLDTLAQRLEPKATWDEIVLPTEELNTLHQIAEQVKHRSYVYNQWGFQKRMNRGFGINILFAGESGTGKTMAAEVLANALNLNLYRIDLSSVINKYIGETEKNLRRLFDAAEDGGAILFFDEADALFGSRSEVKDSHDRYANIEVNYLLQRIESFQGLAILATNLKNSLDQAFLRRLRFVINFPFPALPERKQLWQKAFPEDTPILNLDYDYLAKLNLAGGSIHNIAINAAFLAKSANSPVKMNHILTAARYEFHKLEHSINEADFIWQTEEAVR